MSDIEYGFEGLKLTASVLLLFFAVRWLHKAVLANWRQDLFALRNDLWDAMRVEGCLESDAHRRLRRDINGVIRIGPSLNLVSFLVTLRLTRTHPSHSQVASLDPHAGLTDRAKATLKASEHRLVYLVLERMFFHSFPGYFIGWPLYGMYFVFRSLRFTRACLDRTIASVKPKIRGWAQEVEPVALAVEQDRVPVGA